MIVVISLLSLLTLTLGVPLTADDLTLFDFTDSSSTPNLDAWKEVSDTVRVPGKSKAAFVLQQTKVFQRAVFFGMLNPQPNGAGFAGFRTAMPALSDSQKNAQGLSLNVRGQGELDYYKIVLNQADVNYDFEYKFLITQKDSFTEQKLLFSDFKAYYRGKEVANPVPLDLLKVDKISLQTFGGVYEQYKQSGTGSLEIDNITFFN